MIEYLRATDQSVPRTNNLGLHGLDRFQRLNPLPGMTIAHVVVRAIDTGIPRKQDAFLRELCKAVSMGMGDSEMNQFDALLAIVKNHGVGK